MQLQEQTKHEQGAVDFFLFSKLAFQYC